MGKHAGGMPIVPGGHAPPVAGAGTGGMFGRLLGPQPAPDICPAIVDASVAFPEATACASCVAREPQSGAAGGVAGVPVGLHPRLVACCASCAASAMLPAATACDACCASEAQSCTTGSVPNTLLLYDMRDSFTPGADGDGSVLLFSTRAR